MKRYFIILKNHKKSLLILFLITLVSSIFTIGMTYVGGLFIDIVVKSNNMYSIYKICGILLLITSVSLVTKFVITFQSGIITETLIYDLKKRILVHLKEISLIQYSKFNVAYLSKRIDEDARQIIKFFINNFSSIFIKTIEIMIILIIVFKLNIFIGVIMLLLCPAYYFLYKKFRNIIFSYNLTAKEKEAELFQGITNQLEYMEEIVIEADFEREEKILDDCYFSYIDSYKKLVTINSKFTFCQGLLICIMQIVIFLIGGYSVLQGYTTIGNLSILMSYFMQILNNITYYIEIGRDYQITKSSIFRMNKIFDLEKNFEGKTDIEKVEKIHADLTFEIDNKQILNKIKVDAKSGQVIGIIGENGSGKTTMIKLLIGLYKGNATCNIIYNEYMNINEMSSLQFRKKFISYVSQKIRFRDITVKETLNEIRQFNLSEDLIKYLEENRIPITNNLKDFLIRTWNLKVNTLSGGDKQLIAIIRCIIKNSSILIFDEPTSNLDINRCLWFDNMIMNLKENKIIFIITHDRREKNIFDRIIYL